MFSFSLDCGLSVCHGLLVLLFVTGSLCSVIVALPGHLPDYFALYHTVKGKGLGHKKFINRIDSRNIFFLYLNKESASPGGKFFLFRVDHFSKGVGVQVKHQERTNVVSRCLPTCFYTRMRELVQSLLKAGKKHFAQQFNFTYRYIDEVLSQKNTKFAEYPRELEIKETTETAASSSYLDYLYIDNGKLTTRLYDKRDDFNFPIVNFPFLSCNIPSAPAYGVYVSQLIHYVRACSNY